MVFRISGEKGLESKLAGKAMEYGDVTILVNSRFSVLAEVEETTETETSTESDRLAEGKSKDAGFLDVHAQEKDIEKNQVTIEAKVGEAQTRQTLHRNSKMHHKVLFDSSS